MTERRLQLKIWARESFLLQLKEGTTSIINRNKLCLSSNEVVSKGLYLENDDNPVAHRSPDKKRKMSAIFSIATPY